jgi:hypothetical protein
MLRIEIGNEEYRSVENEALLTIFFGVFGEKA